jgi:hypothetical protein
MFETDPENPRSNLQVFLGFLLGIVASLGCLFLTIMLAGNMGSGSKWIYPAFNAVALICIGAVALRYIRQSSYAIGAVIALALALLLDAACAVAFFR